MLRKYWCGGASSGTDCCLLAYGQTGSGKSYSVFGDACDEGILMRSMRGETTHMLDALLLQLENRCEDGSSGAPVTFQTSSGSLKSMRGKIFTVQKVSQPW